MYIKKIKASNLIYVSGKVLSNFNNGIIFDNKITTNVSYLCGYVSSLDINMFKEGSDQVEVPFIWLDRLYQLNRNVEKMLPEVPECLMKNKLKLLIKNIEELRS